MENRENPGFMTGLPELLILRLLQDRDMYGYEIVQAIARGDRRRGHPRRGGGLSPAAWRWRRTAR